MGAGGSRGGAQGGAESRSVYVCMCGRACVCACVCLELGHVPDALRQLSLGLPHFDQPPPRNTHCVVNLCCLEERKIPRSPHSTRQPWEPGSWVLGPNVAPGSAAGARERRQAFAQEKDRRVTHLAHVVMRLQPQVAPSGYVLPRPPPHR